MTRVFLLMALLLSSAGVQGQAGSQKREFPVFDAMGFSQKPNLRDYGIKPITVAYSGFLFEGGKIPEDLATLPDRSRIIAIDQIAAQSTDTLVIDIEHWPLIGDPAIVADSIRKYETVIKWFKMSTTSKVGYYSIVPVRNYWAAVQAKDSPEYKAWQKSNDNMAPVAQLADIFFPSIYTFYDDRAGWSKYAVAQIQEARRYAGGKPVYVFLWPQYHGSNKTIGGAFLPGDYWRMELETARKYADGIVFWCCSSKQQWDDNAPWWVETKSFLKEVNSGSK